MSTHRLHGKYRQWRGLGKEVRPTPGSFVTDTTLELHASSSVEQTVRQNGRVSLVLVGRAIEPVLRRRSDKLGLEGRAGSWVVGVQLEQLCMCWSAAGAKVVGDALGECSLVV